MVGVRGHASEPVHQGVDALRLGRVGTAQRRPGSSSKPVGGLGPAALTQRSQRIQQNLGQLVMLVSARNSHGPIVFTRGL